MVHDGQPDADDRRRPAVRRRAWRHRQPVGRDHRTERHRPRPRRVLPILVRHLLERGRQERTQRSSGWRSTRSTRTSRPTSSCSRPTRHRRATRSSSRRRPSCGQVAFQIGGSPDPWTFCVDNVSLAGGAAPEPYVPDTGPRVRVNQVGYLPHGPKGATLVTDATEPLAWELKNASGRVVEVGRHASGRDRHHVRAQRPRDRLQPLRPSR